MSVDKPFEEIQEKSNICPFYNTCSLRYDNHVDQRFEQDFCQKEFQRCPFYQSTNAGEDNISHESRLNNIISQELAKD